MKKIVDASEAMVKTMDATDKVIQKVKEIYDKPVQDLFEAH